MTQIISNSTASCALTDALWENPTFEQDFSAQQVSFEWIQSLPAEQKDAALYRLFRTIEARPTLVELLCDSFSRNLNKGDDWLEWSNPFKGRVRTYFLHQ